jgi:hypothetical protein
VFCSREFFEGPMPWGNHGGPFANVGFYKDQLGIVHLKGVVGGLPERVAAESSIFRLPPAYRPANRRVFPSVGDNDAGGAVSEGRVDVQPNGLVTLVRACSGASAPDPNDCSTSGGYIALDGISFRRDG